MIVQPRIKGFICTTAHPVGCKASVKEQIDYVKSQKNIEGGPKKVLIIGASTGYGLASRVVSAFGGTQAGTIGVFFEREPEENKVATPGWYNTVAFEDYAIQDGLYVKSFNGDAFSAEMKQRVAETIKKDLGQVDLIIYSLASPRRLNPKTGNVDRSVLKPINASYTTHSLNLSTNKLEIVTINEAVQEEIDQTISVMGGEDWEMWIDALLAQGLIKEGAKTVAYSYVGPDVTRGIYRNGTIGRAKDHLESTAFKLDEKLKKIKGSAFVSVNKALVTQSSSAIPFIPLYYMILSKVMKQKNVDEGCIEQMYRLFANRLFAGGPVSVDEKGLIRVDDWEMRVDIQNETTQNWLKLTDENLKQYADIDGYHEEFLKLFGFGIPSVDYGADVDINLPLPSLQLK